MSEGGTFQISSDSVLTVDKFHSISVKTALVSFQGLAMTSRIPKGFHLPAETKKIDHKLESKASAPPAAAHKSDGILKHTKENVPKKNVATKVYKGISRYGQQTELKEQNQHLTAANEELQSNLSEMQQRVAELELQFSELEKENMDVKKNLKDCHVLLVAAQIDPVLGEKVGEAAGQTQDQRQDVMNVSKELLNELKAFGEIASQQRAQLEEIQTTMADLTKAREHMMQERENFSQQAAEIIEASKEAEALLV